MTDVMKMITTFVDAIALIMALILTISLLQRNSRRHLRNSVVMGAMFSFAVVMTMSNPIMLINVDGIFDMRCVLVGTATALLGPVAGAITFGTGLAYRSLIGGAGVVPEGVGMGVVFAMGWIWYAFIKNLKWRKWVKSLILGAMISGQALAFLVAPAEARAEAFAALFPFMVVSSFLGSFLIHHLITAEFSFISEAQASRINANTDHLTGLLNRRGLELTYLDLDRLHRQPPGRALLYFDVDRFKHTNDQYGHAVGDDVLNHVVNIVASKLRMHDIFVRLGGDEFAVILPEVDATEAEAIAERCRASISQTVFAVGQKTVPISISVGAIWMQDAADVDDMLAAADRALYQAKSQGRNTVVFVPTASGGHGAVRHPDGPDGAAA